MSPISPAEFGISRIAQRCNISESDNISNFLVLEQHKVKWRCLDA